MNEQQNPQPRRDPGLTTGRREAVFGLATVFLGLLLTNCLLFGGLNLGAALCLGALLLAAVLYLRRQGCATGWYGWILLGLSFLILPGFVRSDDGCGKFVLLCFCVVAGNLGLTILAGKLRQDPGQIGALWEVPRVFFGLGVRQIPSACRGVGTAVREGGTMTKNSSAVLVGLCLALPILAVMIPLLMRADAAFEGLLDLLPEFEFYELFCTALFGIPLVLVLYTRTVALFRIQRQPAPEKNRKGMSPLTVNTVLLAVDGLYLVYLMSQLAYFAGGFSGILPQGYSLAEYARRGFFEMAWLCAINLSVMILGGSMAEPRQGKAPLSTRLCCLFLGLVTLFLVAAAGAKMVLYIGSYGMTRLRVLTMVIMGFLGLTTAVLCVWLFRPKLPYMQVVLLAGLVLGIGVLWSDVDTVVANYNSESYLSGRLETVDVSHLSGLGSGAIPALDRLAQNAPDPEIRQKAEDVLRGRTIWNSDLRGWNWTDHQAREILEAWPGRIPENPYPEDMELLPSVDTAVASQIESFILAHQEELEALALNHFKGETAVRTYETVKIDGCFDNIVQFFDSSIGLVPASQYYGFYYAMDGLPHCYQNVDLPLEQISENLWYWTDGTDNGGLTKHITGNWYYYEAWF